MKNDELKVILAAGGSGGHIFPAVEVARQLEKKGVRNIYFISSKRKLDRNILGNTKYRCCFLSVNPMPLRFNIVKMFTFLVKFVYDAVVCFFIVLKVRPNVVVGFGGYSSGAIARLAKLFKVPVIIHEQNLVPGRANKMLGRVSDKIAVSFKGSEDYFPGQKEKITYTGNPIRVADLVKDRTLASRNIGLSGQVPTVLIMGGSQGSSFLNSTASQAALKINEKTKGKVQFIHLTGKKDFESIKEFYRKYRISARVFSFLEKIADAYAACDMAISRSGAAALFELAYYARPMILVPYPNPKNNQKSNAVCFSNAGAAVYREEKDLTPEGLTQDILEVLQDEARRNDMSVSAEKLSRPDAGVLLADEVISLANKKRKERFRL